MTVEEKKDSSPEAQLIYISGLTTGINNYSGKTKPDNFFKSLEQANNYSNKS